jgi:MATE family multidrug resistance protein
MHSGVISLRAELRDTLKLAAPLVLNQVGHMSMGIVDTLVAGHISTTALAGLGLAANSYWTFTSVCVGCLFALDTYFSQSVGAKDEGALRRYFGQAFWLAGMVVVAAAFGVVLGAWTYLSLAPRGDLQKAFALYTWTIVWCLPSLFFYAVISRYWQARQRVLPFTLIILSANVLNLVLCVGFGLGKWGLPALGIRGIAWSTVICRYAMLVAALVFTWSQLRPSTWRLPGMDWAVQRRFLRLGLPAAGHIGLEVGVFSIATFVAGALGEVPLAAHHTCLMMASFTFMFPLGFSAAAAVRVGTFIGARQPEHARVAGWLCIGVSALMMGGFAIMYLTIPGLLLGLFTPDPAVITIGRKILVLIALFEIADGVQVSSTGALRGAGDTRSALRANLIGHYPIGLLLGLLLCWVGGFGVVGLWTGLALGLVMVALMLLRAWHRTAGDPERLRPVVTGILESR